MMWIHGVQILSVRLYWMLIWDFAGRIDPFIRNPSEVLDDRGGLPSELCNLTEIITWTHPSGSVVIPVMLNLYERETRPRYPNEAAQYCEKLYMRVINLS